MHYFVHVGRKFVILFSPPEIPTLQHNKKASPANYLVLPFKLLLFHHMIIDFFHATVDGEYSLVPCHHVSNYTRIIHMYSCNASYTCCKKAMLLF